MDTRRDFLKKGALLSGALGVSQLLPASIQRAISIDPTPGSTFMDAEHVVILMQENRSFDHCFGTLQGVRGYNDPRAITLPDKNLVWLQKDAAGKTYAPFRFDIKDTKITWMGSTPHNRSSQVDAFNEGKYDRWLIAKQSHDKKYASVPLTLGHYCREDIPFHYALADAFTICDQNFCSAMTSTNPNRLFFWTGTIRDQQKEGAEAYIRNLGNWRINHLKFDTFPERLTKEGINWKFYQNEIDTGGGFTGDERAWLANFGCNPLEWFNSYGVKFAPRYVKSLRSRIKKLPDEIAEMKSKLKNVSAEDNSYKKLTAAISKKEEVLSEAQKELTEFTPENFEKLSKQQKELFDSAFTTNKDDPDYHSIEALNYNDGSKKRKVMVPKGDVLHQFRKDVDSGKLPTVSWIAGAQNFSDHPSAPWYGLLYVSEVLDILTKNPEVWKKTIFIMTYDENDGYYDHVPPFVAPDPYNPLTGKCSEGLDTRLEYIPLKEELDRGISKKHARSGPVGLGFRVPLIVASPWSRGGNVCSQVFDHTSTLQFLEEFLNKKYKKSITETNISSWRRMITGDLTTVFQQHVPESPTKLPFLEKTPFIESINNAKFKKDPEDFTPLTAEQIQSINQSPAKSPHMSHQEPGVRPARALPYELYADGQLSPDKKSIQIVLKAGNKILRDKSVGAPFNINFPTKYLQEKNNQQVYEARGYSSYGIKPGDTLTDSWPIEKFENEQYHLQVNGPNGFLRELSGNQMDPAIAITCDYELAKGFNKKATGNLTLSLKSQDTAAHTIQIKDNAYKKAMIKKTISPGNVHEIKIDLSKSHQWYDFTVSIDGENRFKRRYAGHVETGKASFTDPYMGGVA